MSILKRKVDQDCLFGCVKYNNKYGIYLMPVVYWILNNKKYNPSYNPNEWEFVFRNNVLNVPDEDIGKYIRAIAIDEVDMNLLKDEIEEMQKSDKYVYFFIDFDRKIFVNAFPEIEVEEYLPDDSWVGLFDEPINYLPDNLKTVFSR